MNNLIVLPMVLPLLVGALLVFFQQKIMFQRTATLALFLVNTVVSILILQLIQKNGIISLDFGGWSAPFGISFVADSFSMLLVLTTNIISIVCLLYAMGSIGPKRERLYFYPFTMMMIAGVNGSFLTGDIFNLFVTFEVMLLASYALITLGATKKQLKASVIYIAINVVSSSLFLIAIAFLYGLVGTLNMADISQKIAETGQTPLLTVVSLLFLMVFSIKSGLMLYQWLPHSYSAPPTAIAALFGALLTKVGIYALFRTFTLLFYHEQQITHTLIGIMAVITLLGGCIGAIAYTDIRQIVAYNLIIAVGFILIALAVMNIPAFEGAIYYLMHDMLMKALLFILAGTIIYLTKTAKLDEMSGLIRNYPLLGWMFFIVVLSLTGIPPLSGFIGKVLIGEGAIESGSYILLGVGFFSSLIVLYSLLRIFMSCFWGETIISTEEKRPFRKSILFPGVILVVCTFLLGFGAEAIAPHVQHAAQTLMNPNMYIEAVLEK